MRTTSFLIVVLLTSLLTQSRADQLLFKDDFKGKLQPGWKWKREHREAWRINECGLQVRIEPGNMWGPANNAKNILIHPIPATTNTIQIAVTFEHFPTAQYEQADLVWYYDDSNMVKLGEELVDGVLCVVMGREQNDKIQTIAKIPLPTNSVRLRLTVKANRIRGEYLRANEDKWFYAGECDLPSKGDAKASLQFYQGPDKSEHWATVRDFEIRTATNP